MTIERWLKLTIKQYNRLYGKRKELRLGQFLLNRLYPVNPALFYQVTGHREADPFYNDDKIPAFIVFITKNWDLT